jgi:hypothetical protein
MSVLAHLVRRSGTEECSSQAKTEALAWAGRALSNKLQAAACLAPGVAMQVCMCVFVCVHVCERMEFTRARVVVDCPALPAQPCLVLFG